MALVKSNSVFLQWNDVGGTADVDYEITWNSTYSNKSKILIKNKNKTAINEWNSNQEYVFQVQARNSGGQGEMSEPKIFFTR